MTGSKRNMPTRHARSGLGTEIDHNIHLEGYRLWRMRTQPVHIRRELGITAAQLRWLTEVGSQEYPSWRKILINEAKTIVSNARESAIRLSVEASQAIALRAKNARKANEIVDVILTQLAEGGVATTLGENGDPDGFEVSVLDRNTLATLKILTKITDLGPVANAFRTIYGDVAAHKGLYPERDAPKQEGQSGDPLRALQGHTVARDDFLDEESYGRIVDELRHMTDGELEEFARGGKEAVVDVESRLVDDMDER